MFHVNPFIHLDEERHCESKVSSEVGVERTNHEALELLPVNI